MTLPVIRLEVEGMKASIVHAMSEYTANLDADIKAAVDAYCEPIHLEAIIADQVFRILDGVVREEVERFYRYGEGRAAVRVQIEKVLATYPSDSQAS